MGNLTVKETTALAKHEAVIEDGKGTFLKVGNALAAIKEGKLYRGTHKTFGDYTADKWKFKDSIRITLAAKSLPKHSEAAKERQSTPPNGVKPALTANLQEPPKGEATEAAAEEFNVKPRTVAKAKNVLEQGIPELQEAMTEGDISVSLAERISQTPDTTQKDIVDGLATGKMSKKQAMEAATKAVSQLDINEEVGLHPAVIRLLEMRSEYKAKRSALTVLKTWLDSEAVKGNSLLGCELKNAHELITDLSSLVSACSPHAPCPYCSAIPADDPKFACSPCRGSGVVNKMTWENAPKDSKRREMSEAMAKV